MFFLGGVLSFSLIEHALTERLQFEPLRPPPGQTRLTVDDRCMARYIILT